ncbi:hypothetical protein IE53DRAFT_367368 [Violaceomyces palustris]|uniref:Uncharacterized protein n=1 Tax=Violaceomyces palustris TaxID=1673888 RepID=A0ACD0P2U3_9BASI|nr:hypothetical protein IE53DRAFT_367368 [Violaceomyces palustris]
MNLSKKNEIDDNLWRLWIRFASVWGLTVMESWEQLFTLTILGSFSALFILTIFNLPSYVELLSRRLFYYITGQVILP